MKIQKSGKTSRRIASEEDDESSSQQIPTKPEDLQKEFKELILQINNVQKEIEKLTDTLGKLVNSQAKVQKTILDDRQKLKALNRTRERRGFQKGAAKPTGIHRLERVP